MNFTLVKLIFLMCCSAVSLIGPHSFQCLNRIAEGTFGVVYRARDKKTQDIVALKRLKMEREKEGFPITSLREINTLLISQHRNVVTVREIVVGSNMDKIFIGELIFLKLIGCGKLLVCVSS